jgi:hypothetical protein
VFLIRFTLIRYAEKGEVQNIVETLRIAAAEMDAHSLQLPSSLLHYCVDMIRNQASLTAAAKRRLDSLSRRLGACHVWSGRAPVFGLLIDLEDVLKAA